MTPGRALALIIGVPVLIALIVFTGLSAVGQAEQVTTPVHVAIPVSNGQVTATIHAGDVTLRQAAASAGQGSTASLTGTAHSSFARGNLTVHGSMVSYSCPLPFGNCGLDTTLHAPPGTGVSLHTSGGDVTIPSFAGRLTVHSSGGDFYAGHLSGGADLVTSGGDVSVTSAQGPLQVTSSGGDVSFEGLATPTAVIKSTGGDVSLVFTRMPRSVQVTTSGGDVSVVLPRARYRISANATGGDVSNDLGDDPSASSSVTVNSLGGDVSIQAS